MKRTICVLSLMVMMMGLAACQFPSMGKKQAEPTPTPTASSAVTTEQKGEKVVHGVINRLDSYLVLITDDDEYQIMDYAEGVSADGFAEGDKVNVTYTGKLGVESETPVIIAIEKAE